MMSLNVFISKRRFISGCALTLLLLMLSCSKSTDPDTNKPPDTGPVGILLSGADSDSALSGTSNHGPFAVPENEWEGDFVTTRLEAVINPNATVGAVNTALNAVGAKISCMRAGLMFTELVVSAQASVGQAELTCSTLVASSAFLSAYPAYLPTRLAGSDLFPDFPANGILTHLEQARFPAAWNLRELAASRNSPVTIVVGDGFRSFTPHPEVPAQSFLPGRGILDQSIDAAGSAGGNHGFKVAGVVGARFDDLGTTGAFLNPPGQLRLPCFSVDGFATYNALLAEIDDRLPIAGNFILNTSFGYDGDFSRFSKRRRIEHALVWRALVASKQDRFVHATSAGNEGFASNALPNATYNSPFALSARYDTPLEMLLGTEVSAKDSSDLLLLYNSAVTMNAATSVKTHNLLVVGSSDKDGNLSTFSNLPSDVRMIGEGIWLPCIYDDAECGSGTGVALQAHCTGTSYSTPQVAGLAAWLWALSPALSINQTITILKNCYDGRWIDAFKAVLSLDNSLGSAQVRLSLLDIVDVNGQIGSNGQFDEKDIQMFLDSINFYQADRGSSAPPWVKDHSIFDLNGDGFTGDTSGVLSEAPFDLDINAPPAYSSVYVFPCDQPTAEDTTFDENAVTDRNILFYYAYSPLYTGSDSLRDEMFGVSCSPYWVGGDWSYIREFVYFPALNIYEDDTSSGAALSFNIDETRDSISPYCKDTAIGFRWQLTSNCNASLGASAGSASLSVDGSASLLSRATATAPIDPSGCRYNIQGGHSSIKAVRFALSGDAISAPFSLVVSGIVQPTSSAHSATEIARCVVELHIVDTTLEAQFAGAAAQQQPAFLTFDSDLNPLPFQLNSALSPLSGNRVYELKVYASTMAIATTQLYPGPNEAKVEVNVSLFVGE